MHKNAQKKVLPSARDKNCLLHHDNAPAHCAFIDATEFETRGLKFLMLCNQLFTIINHQHIIIINKVYIYYIVLRKQDHEKNV